MVVASVVKGGPGCGIDRGVASDEVNAARRVSARIKQRLEELGTTNRAFGQSLGRNDAWVSSLLSNKFDLLLRELDRVASVLRLPAGELVRFSDEAWDLTPTEMRVVRSLRMLPPVVRDHIMLLADYLVGATPPEIEFLQRVRRLEDEDRRRIVHWVDVSLGASPTTARPLGPEETSVERAGRALRPRGRRKP